MEFREELRRQALGLRGNLPDDWENTAEAKLFGASSGQSKQGDFVME